MAIPVPDGRPGRVSARIERLIEEIAASAYAHHNTHTEQNQRSGLKK
jgi:hypothetical protein